MPRVKPLTEEQAVRWATKILCDEIMNRVKERKGLYDLTDYEVADRLHISPTMYGKYKNGGLEKARFDLVLRAVHFAGYELSLKKIDEKPKRQAVSAKKDDTYGTVIEGLIRKIVEECIENQKNIS